MIKEPKGSAEEREKDQINQRARERGDGSERRFSPETPRYSKPSTPARCKLLMGGLN